MCIVPRTGIPVGAPTICISVVRVGAHTQSPSVLYDLVGPNTYMYMFGTYMYMYTYMYMHRNIYELVYWSVEAPRSTT